MNSTDRAILIGLVWGDGYIRTQKNSNGKISYSLAIEHSQKQRAYLDYKAKLLTSVIGGKHPVVYERSRFDKRTENTYHQCQIVKGHKVFRLLRKRIYKDRSKVICKSWLRYVTPLTLSLLFQDDGYNKSRRNKEGRITSSQTYLGLYCPRQEAIIFQEWLKDTYKIGCSIHQRKNGQCTICMNTVDSHKFCKLIAEYVHPSMAYKMNHVNLDSQEC